MQGIDESELKDDDVVVRHIREDAKYEEKEKDGTKEQVEVSPAKESKNQQTPGFHQRYPPAVNKTSKRVQR